MKRRYWWAGIAAAIGIYTGMWCMAPAKYRAPSTESELMARVVRLTSESGRGSCSGEQVRATSGKDYILTAAHCLSLASSDGSMQVITEDGRKLARKVIVEDAFSDLALIEGLPNTDGIAIARNNHRNQKVRTFTHGKALATYRTEGVLIEEQEIAVMLDFIVSPEAEAKCRAKSKQRVENVWFFKICILKVREMATTAMIVPGSSGGMVVDADGALVGVVSAGGDGMGWLVPLSDIQAFLSNY